MIENSFVDKIIVCDVMSGLSSLPDRSVNCCVTSPPYYGLRDYGVDGQIGLEETPEMYVQKLVDVFREVKRVLRDNGTLWLNLGDSYCGYKGKHYGDTSGNLIANTPVSEGASISFGTPQSSGLKNKDLMGIPWMVAFALRADGWYLRQDIIWNKPNPMPESVRDRCTKAHEYIFLLSKSPRYYYDADSIKTPIKDSSFARLCQDIDGQTGSDRVPGKTNGNMKACGNGWNGSSFDTGKTGEMKHTRGGKSPVKFDGNKADGCVTRIHSGKEWSPSMGGGGTNFIGHSGNYDKNGYPLYRGMANKRSVWTVTTKPFKEAHFATFPEDLIVNCIKAGCPKGGLVLDPFMGAGTTALVSRKLSRHYIGFEINPKYAKIAEARISAFLSGDVPKVRKRRYASPCNQTEINFES